MTSPTAQLTDFSRDILGRYLCNGLDEAIRSTGPSSSQPDARPFDVIVVGGGSFGSAVAQHLFFQDRAHQHRILVLEAGQFVLPEHIQNLPLLSASSPPEVWGIPWKSSIGFPGLAYCIGGRSLFWGGWCPEPLDAELAPQRWPAALLTDLKSGPTSYYRQASDQTGVTESNYFVFGALQEALRQRLHDGITAGSVADAIPLAKLPDDPAVTRGASVDQLRQLLGFDTGAGPSTVKALSELLKLEAPLAVQVRAPSGEFPINKFSAVPLLFMASRAAYLESPGDDVHKRLMLVPNCHVMRLLSDGKRVTAIQTSQGTIPVPAPGLVVIALGTIESTRLSLVSFGGIPNYDRIGRNLFAHLRSNLTIRLPRASLPIPASVTEFQAAALFVKGRHVRADGTAGHFHLQITASGLGAVTGDAEADLFKKIPDIDTLQAHRRVHPDRVVVTIRGIGEMETDNPKSGVTLDAEVDEYGVPRARVELVASDRDNELWEAMDAAADQVATVFAGNQPYEVLPPFGMPIQVAAGQSPKDTLPRVGRRDGLGSTHHEAGTLLIGEDPASSVTDVDARFHHVENAYAVGPALFPSIGSPNPMLTGIALARRLGDHLIGQQIYQPEKGFTALFDSVSTDAWRMAGAGKFVLVDGTLTSVPGNDLGLYWCTTPLPADFILKLEWARTAEDDNSGVFIRFPDPRTKGYGNQAYVGVDFGFEVQIDELARWDGLPIHRTGAIYGEASQTVTVHPAKPVGDWNEFEIRVQVQAFSVLLNAQQTTQFENTNPSPQRASTAGGRTFMGVQAHTGRVAFRNIRIQSLVAAAPGLTKQVAATAGAKQK